MGAARRAAQVRRALPVGSVRLRVYERTTRIASDLVQHWLDAYASDELVLNSRRRASAGLPFAMEGPDGSIPIVWSLNLACSHEMHRRLIGKNFSRFPSLIAYNFLAHQATKTYKAFWKDLNFFDTYYKSRGQTESLR